MDILCARIKFCEKLAILLICKKNTTESPIDNFLCTKIRFLQHDSKMSIFR
jgi:hypothetical protein